MMFALEYLRWSIELATYAEAKETANQVNFRCLMLDHI